MLRLSISSSSDGDLNFPPVDPTTSTRTSTSSQSSEIFPRQRLNPPKPQPTQPNPPCRIPRLRPAPAQTRLPPVSSGRNRRQVSPTGPLE